MTAGFAHAHAPTPPTAEQIAFIRTLAEDQCPLREIVRTTGVTLHFVEKYTEDIPRRGPGPALGKKHRALAEALGLAVA